MRQLKIWNRKLKKSEEKSNKDKLLDKAEELKKALSALDDAIKLSQSERLKTIY